MKNKLLILAILIVVIIILAFVFGWFPNERTEDLDDSEQAEEILDKSLMMGSILEDEATEKINLSAVDGSDSMGTAYRLIKDNKFMHIIEADMPEPEGDNKYEGWLVQPSPLKFFSTGVMDKNDQGNWYLEYESSQYSSSYYRVVITLETVVDPNPEKHIIEGDFSSNGQEVGKDVIDLVESVMIKNFAFSPSKIIVKKGTEVIWTNTDSVGHTITSDTGNELDSELLEQNMTFTHTFNEAGDFNYHCSPHPFMKGQIIVED